METKVMIVVEGDLYGRLLAKEFRSKGHVVCAVLARGEDAVEEAMKTKPDTILLDFLLKGNLDGIEAAKMIQKQSPAHIVFLNNHFEKNWISRSKEVNTSLIINKNDAPLEDLVNTVKSATKSTAVFERTTY